MIESPLSEKVILITGGTGSFGQEFTKQALTHNPHTVRIFSRGELLQSEMRKKFNDDRLRFFIGDVRDKDRLWRALQGVDIIVHAAALKQVPTCEYNPFEAIRTNIIGSVNLVDAAIDARVKKIMLISSDKACQPINLYGATKLVAERLFVQANSYAGSGETKFSVVRYGNVIGSRGSVIPLFCEQRSNGKLTITDLKMTRFWISLEQGANFVIECLNRMVGGEIFIPKIPSMRIVDLARAIAPGAKHEIIGVRPGEKQHEVLLTEAESNHCREYDTYFVVEPEHPFWTENKLTGGRVPPREFAYTSSNNGWKLSEKELQELLK